MNTISNIAEFGPVLDPAVGSEERFRSAMRHASIGMAIVAPDGRWLEVNPAFCDIVGYTPNELLATDFQSITHPDDLSADLEPFQRILRGESSTYQAEKRYLHKGGHVIWVQLNVSLVRNADAEPAYFIAQIQDITARRRAEERIREQARLLDLAHDAILVRDLEDRILFWNQGAERLYGWTASEAVGQKAARFLSRDEFKYQQARNAVLKNGDWQGEFVNRSKSGENVLVESHWTLICDREGAPKSIFSISTDATEKQKLQTQLLRAQRMESLGTLAGGIAHDLNNVLTPILISVQMLKEKVNDADGQKLLQALETNVQRGAGLLKQVLAFGRGMEGERVPVNPRHIAREIKQIVHETFPKSVSLEVNAPGNLWPVTGDPTQLHQVLLNLCVNARDAMPKGGKLTLRLENVVFDEIYAGMNLEAKAGPYVCLRVSDTGTGIPKEIQEKIFDPFFTTKEPGKGTGLGLSTTLAIVKGHGGFIQCESEVGRGSTFRVYLPANPSAGAVENPAPPSCELPRGNGELVLVVDDEEPIRKLAQRVLECFGYHALLAGDGVEAISLYSSRQAEIAAVVIDMAMPVMDGPTTIVALKAINPDVKIICSSGMAADDGLARAMAAGVQHFISKPYTAEAMLNTLHEVLQSAVVR